jgi:hypothetical protein
LNFEDPINCMNISRYMRASAPRLTEQNLCDLDGKMTKAQIRRAINWLLDHQMIDEDQCEPRRYWIISPEKWDVEYLRPR